MIFTFLFVLSLCLVNVVGLVLSVSQVNIYYKGNIVIDAGHGGIDGGVSDGNIKESDITLKIAYNLKDELEKDGYKVILTRHSKDALGEDKKSDMEERKKIINKVNPLITISVHINKFTSSNVRGVRVFYDDTNKYKTHGEIMQNTINSMINKKYINRVDLKAQGGDYFITKCSSSPSIIVECGFLSNENDKKLMLSNSYRIELSKAITTGVNNIFDNKT